MVGPKSKAWPKCLMTEITARNHLTTAAEVMVNGETKADYCMAMSLRRACIWAGDEVLAAKLLDLAKPRKPLTTKFLLLATAPNPVGMPSTHRWKALAPTRLEHRLPHLNGVMPQHPSAGLRNWVVRWTPMEGSQQDPLTMSRWRIR